jgi:Fe2+ or Zn2+ uptake regulation protein
MSACERLQLRMTDARRAILVCLADRQAPASLARIGQDQRVRDSFDATTIYRTVILLKNLEIVGQINAGNKLRYFVLNAPDESYAFLICQGCGKITSLVLERADETPVAEAVSLGYAKVVRLVEVRGLCPRCQTKPGIATLSPKLPVRCAKDENIHARRVSQ